MKKTITVKAPGTVANVACGFDILGFALEQPGDTITVSLTDESREIYIGSMENAAGLPRSPEENVATVAVKAMKNYLGFDQGVQVDIKKGIKSGSGIGSSAASSAGAVVALNKLLNAPCLPEKLVEFAMEGERIASGTPHADNVAPAIMGGFILVRGYTPLDIIQLETGLELYAVVLHPDIEIKTEEARGLLRQQISLKKAIQQWGNVAGFVAGLLQNDPKLISRSMVDVIIEPIRSILIPEYEKVRRSALDAGALGCSISGSGPSVFALCESRDIAKKTAENIRRVYNTIALSFDIHISAINRNGCEVLTSNKRT